MGIYFSIMDKDKNKETQITLTAPGAYLVKFTEWVFETYLESNHPIQPLPPKEIVSLPLLLSMRQSNELSRLFPGDSEPPFCFLLDMRNGRASYKKCHQFANELKQHSEIFEQSPNTVHKKFYKELMKFFIKVDSTSKYVWIH